MEYDLEVSSVGREKCSIAALVDQVWLYLWRPQISANRYLRKRNMERSSYIPH